MTTPINSAGLIYVYIKGIADEDGFLIIQTIDSYQYMEDAFYQKVMESMGSEEENKDIVYILAVAGIVEKTLDVHQVIEEELKENFRRLLNGKSVRKFSKKLDGIGNILNRWIQELSYEHPEYSPGHLFEDYEDFIFLGFCYSRLPSEQRDAIVDSSVALWIEHEKPYLYGQQLLIQSFFLRDFVGRKAVACIPQMDTGSWRMVFEGGHQLALGNGFSYMKGTMHPNDLVGFCSSNIQTILTDPVYAYGIALEPNDLFEEWNKVFIYLCACSNKIWDEDSLTKVYETFLEFIQANICESVEAEPMISKQTYYRALLIHIERFRDFIKGEDEPVISKDLHQTMNSRYVYLPYLWSLVPHDKESADFSPSVLRSMVKEAIINEDAYKKGILWEDAASYMLKGISEWKITGRRIRAGAQEIDISLVNISLDNALWQLGAYILVECKNWRERIGLHHIRNIAHISNMKGNKTVILFAASGVTEKAVEEIGRLAAEGLSILCVTAEELLEIEDLLDCKNLILRKWKMLQDTIQVAAIL